VFYKKPLTWRIWGAALISITGVVFLFFPALKENWEETHSGHATHFLLGLGLALTATLASTFGNLVVAQVRKHNDNVVLSMGWAMAWGTLWVSLFVILTGQSWVVPTGARYWLSLLYLAWFGSVIAFACYFTLIHRIGAQKTVFIGVITPIISVLLSIKLEDYQPGWIEWFGMTLCLSGVIWALRGKPSEAQQTALASE
jgi:drug/metabolite transporter (DMT)-like permease